MNEYTIAESIRQTIIANMEGFDSKNVIVDFPDPTALPSEKVIYIVMDESSYEPMTTIEDLVTATYQIYVLAKGRKRSELSRIVYETKDELHEVLRHNQCLVDNSSDSVQVDGVSYFAPDTNTGIVPAIEMSVTVQFTMVHH